jgi:hypothetical protein
MSSVCKASSQIPAEAQNGYDAREESMIRIAQNTACVTISIAMGHHRNWVREATK